jgi:PAP_fibrillin
MKSICILLQLLSLGLAWNLPNKGNRCTIRMKQLTIDQSEVSAKVANTDRGRIVEPDKRQELENYFHELEKRCTDPSPARNPFVQGRWLVEYTDASAPSNGQLGPFAGIAMQEVDLETNRYTNILKVPPNDWLTATL